MTTKHNFKSETLIDDKYIGIGASLLGWTPQIKHPDGNGGETEIPNPKSALDFASDRFKAHVDSFFLPLMEQIIVASLKQQEEQMKAGLLLSY